VDDVRGLLDHLEIDRAHVCGLSMGGYATLVFGLTYPERARSLVVAGCGYGSGGDRAGFRGDAAGVAQRLEAEGMAPVADFYSRGPTRVQFMEKDPVGWREFRDRLAAGSARTRLTCRGGIVPRSTWTTSRQLSVPTLVVTGDEDEPCLGRLFMKQKIWRRRWWSSQVGTPSASRAGLQPGGPDFLTAVDTGRWTPRHPESRSPSAILPPDRGPRSG
jgi:pimeloyl-ACP methyl ester carboxylesterase